ncbi:UDP-3-O-[3-hydroxymyristoyl] glucosamine N-acyltransferase [Parabacteroides sp. PF5-5]|uniref:UDP-3-O-(3-hydroxymyristoyl)glucosamine N-acyltransferase n=1 Tax=unclassified Parabacteroides TaxID=2649774 RepID=UPI0024738F64|nr:MULTISPECIES: UDP-3-O-(3-hydroxymyristoyl)glucosamine N-acyltransferase [unclassified Parabacteroides]MDH6304403.1 UDP-3-O-[3-hydroxymyristoyl] glucosamine N-acyltransferase [Parabacteroides sp. PH5-39]MDH6315444.1 UDP-3-O-[3-hydroxymyristoyl] glucosamine N-acyltransferase [Parabacteroides sp. PF5-13]MDH6319062.1 UDP-3-O-[3-hydroxymyristoyl] glucosamine N-acyltransferase [Parabacteroides sp. PH5-13]MDH6322792.1 UDP-3-O-[3-hydroxymyristoyl] glucosamine N-acyltransferase [Parabacteroides sp. P
MEFTAQQIATFLNGSVEGDQNTKVNNFSKIEEGKPGSLSFLANPKYEHHIYNTEASIVLVNNDFTPTAPIKSTLVRVANAYAALAILLDIVEQSKKKKTGIDPTAFIDATATIGNDCYIGNFAYIGEQTKIGNNCKIYPHAYVGDHVSLGDNAIVYPHVTIYEGCIIGKNCILHAGSVIGSDGFGFAPEGENYKKIPQLGNVILEDDVEVGANTTIDRAVMDSTIIRKGVKLDNLVQIAHNVEVGEHTVMASQVGISGSVKIGKHCQFGGQAGLAGHIRIDDNVSIGAQAGVIGNIEEGHKVLGAPAIDARLYMRSSAVFHRLPDIYRIIGQLQKEVELLKNEINKQDK